MDKTVDDVIYTPTVAIAMSYLKSRTKLINLLMLLGYSREEALLEVKRLDEELELIDGME